MLRVLTAGLVAVLTAGAAVGQSPAGGDQAAIQGNWKPVTARYEELEQMSAEVRGRVTLVFDANQCFLYLKARVGSGDQTQEKVVLLAISTVTLDTTPGVKAIEFTFTDGAIKGQKRHGIYEVAGDQLKLCYGPADKPRPTTFASPRGSGLFNEVWNRQK